MRLLLINEVCGTGSTGKICAGIAETYENNGNEVKIAYGRKAFVPDKCKKYAIRIGANRDVYLHAVKTLIFDQHGFGSKIATKKFIQWADHYNPDIVWLHNIHGYFINIEILFEWIKRKSKMQVKWTLHDCWSFTGHCTHFLITNCHKWKTLCKDCPQKTRYPASRFFDNSESNYLRKKEAFCGVKNLTLFTPSKWLADLTRDSFLKEYPVKVHYNTIDKTVFKPTESLFREKYHIQNKKIILGVASRWSERKGIGDFIELSGLLDDCTVIVMVGVSDKQIKELPFNIIGIKQTNNAQELAEIYSTANIFFNPTREDTYPTVNLEAQACGTRVITYEVGGAKETLHDGKSIAIPVGEYKKVLEYI
ncbi:GDP-mannose-dependent alpha-mannosyltransferase [Desulfosporosinus acididurans]|uniref:GDP-mannose-dependent alpha-mannosyltransferase n=1 Tax=Desulfosporosinus acididurans TaxID=476652 RepID=A0A0J1FT33_9FIRM|nr:glycosyltransferase [Desulfosporosinus acididurans]KLU66128.1 GDP-mannose-dependent alpha-mannosyltransferase [Desulfosporosinus acididurans]